MLRLNLTAYSDVESNLSHTQSLLQSYSRLTSSSSSHTPQVEEARAELRSTLESLEADLEDLDESVRAVEEAGDRWGMDDSEVTRRRKFVERVKGEVSVCLFSGLYLAGRRTDQAGSKTEGHGF